jgi:hypothetical protein
VKKYNFRIRIKLAESSVLGIKTPNREFILPDAHTKIKLSSTNEDIPIEKSKTLSIIGFDFDSEEKARLAGERFQNALMVTFAHFRIGADFGSRTLARTHITDYGLNFFQKQMGVKIINDIHGLMTYESEPDIRFGSFNMKLSVSTSESAIEESLITNLNRKIEFTEIERLAFDFFNMSMFQENIETRFVSLMIALEILILPEKRDEKTIDIIDEFISIAKDSTDIKNDDIESLVRGLSGLKQESINQAGKKLMQKFLSKEQYGNMNVDKFFTACYKIRSKILHGASKFPEATEIGKLVSELEKLVADLLIILVTKD